MFPFISNAYAQSKQASSSNGFMSSFMSMAPMFIGLIAIFFFMIRPQMKKQKELQRLLDGVSTGDEVVTSSGILGKVVHLKDGNVELKIAKEVEITIQKTAITQVLPKGTIRF